MTEIGVRFSITDVPLQILTKPTMARRRRSSIIATPSNLFSHSRRSHQMQYSAVLPIISLSSLTDFREKLVRMTSNNKSTKQTTIQSPTPTEYRLKLPSNDMLQTKARPILFNRSMASNIPKSTISYPNILPRPLTAQRSNCHPQEGARFLYVVNTPAALHRTASARTNHNINLNQLPLHQQPQFLPSPLSPRPHTQYGHFLAYLRRQSLARIRRRQQEHHVDGYTDGIEAIATFNTTRLTPPLFHSPSNLSFGTILPETSSMPTISLQSKRKPRPLSAYRLLQRSSSSLAATYRLDLNQTPLLQLPSSPRISPKKSSDDQPSSSIQTSVLITPANSVVDETIISSTKKPPYELQLSGDMLNYCYVSDSGVKYQGQLLSAPV